VQSNLESFVNAAISNVTCIIMLEFLVVAYIIA
jgi:hypothetical protein